MTGRKPTPRPKTQKVPEFRVAIVKNVPKIKRVSAKYGATGTMPVRAIDGATARAAKPKLTQTPVTRAPNLRRAPKPTPANSSQPPKK